MLISNIWIKSLKLYPKHSTNYLIANENATNSFQVEVLWTGALQINLENNFMWLDFYCFQFLQRQIFTTFDTLSLLNWSFKKARSFWALYFLWSALKSILFCNALHNVPSVLIFQFFFNFLKKFNEKKVKASLPVNFCFSSFWERASLSLKIDLRNVYSLRFIQPTNICSGIIRRFDTSELKRFPYLSPFHFRSNKTP